MFSLCVWTVFLLAAVGSADRGSSAFFLKAPKSVPRAGRAAPGQYESFFLKASKSVPRVGRRDGGNEIEMSVSPYLDVIKTDSLSPQDMENYILYEVNPLTGSDSLTAEYPPQAYKTTLNADNLAHRSRRYNAQQMADPRNGGLSRELQESRYQTEV